MGGEHSSLTLASKENGQGCVPCPFCFRKESPTQGDVIRKNDSVLPAVLSL